MVFLKVTVTVTRPQYKQMCYDMPVPKCSQTPCQTSGQCSAGTSACSNQQSNTATVCPQAAAGQPKPPYASGGCQQVSFSNNFEIISEQNKWKFIIKAALP